ncbi:MotE family protein [Persephonella sp.]
MLRPLLIVGVSIILVYTVHSAESKDPEKIEIQKEIERLTKLREEIKKLLEEKKKILKQIEEKEKALAEKEENIKKVLKKAEEDRYKKLAKVFEKMDPEMAGDKISKMTDPVKAAYIIYNMKERLAGEVMNYVDPEMVDKITRILTDLKKDKKSIEK